MMFLKKAIFTKKDDITSVQLAPDPGVWMKVLVSGKTPSLSCFMGYIWIDPGCSSPRKSLFVEHDVEELYYVISGRADAVYDDGTRHPLGPGTAVLHPSGLKHRLENSYDEPFVFLFFYPKPSAGEITDERTRRETTKDSAQLKDMK